MSSSRPSRVALPASNARLCRVHLHPLLRCVASDGRVAALEIWFVAPLLCVHTHRVCLSRGLRAHQPVSLPTQAHPDGDADARPAAEEATLAHASGEARARLGVGQQCCCAVPDTTSTRPHPRRRARLCHSPQARCAPPAEAALRLTQTVRRRLWLTALSPLLRLPLRRPAPP